MNLNIVDRQFFWKKSEFLFLLLCYMNYFVFINIIFAHYCAIVLQMTIKQSCL